MIKHICFDFDGVILDSLEIHLDTHREAFGLDFTPEQYAVFLEGNFLESKIAKLDWNHYHSILGPKYQTTIFEPEVVEGLQVLARQHTLSINSLAGDDMLDLITTNNGVRDLFVDVWGANTEPYKTTKFKMLMEKHSLDTHEIIFVTDTLGDIREAHEVRIRSIGITGGYHGRDRLEQGRPHAIVDSWKELIKTIDNLS